VTKNKARICTVLYIYGCLSVCPYVCLSISVCLSVFLSPTVCFYEFSTWNKCTDWLIDWLNYKPPDIINYGNWQIIVKTIHSVTDTDCTFNLRKCFMTVTKFTNWSSLQGDTRGTHFMWPVCTLHATVDDLCHSLAVLGCVLCYQTAAHWHNHSLMALHDQHSKTWLTSWETDEWHPCQQLTCN